MGYYQHQLPEAAHKTLIEENPPPRREHQIADAKGMCMITDATSNNNSCIVGDETIRTTSPKKTKRVSFANVVLREYSRVVGDNPNVNGVPLALDWKHTNAKLIGLEKFEERRRGERQPKLKTLDITERICLLRSFGYSDSQLRQAEIQRKIRLTQEWAYGNDTFGAPKGFPLHTTKTILKQYIV